MTGTESADTGSPREPRGPLIGILGGMGPAATADFYAELIRRTPATRDQDHLRVVIWADPTVPDRVGAVLRGTSEPYPAMLEGANNLRLLGATLVAIPCHTAHVFRRRLAEESGLTFLDMVQETVDVLAAQGGGAGAVGLLGTRATLHSRLYQDGCAAAGIPTITPDEVAQRRVDESIRQVKQGRPAAAGTELAAALRRLADAGASTVVLACTELPLALKAIRDDERPAVLNPTDILADAVIRECSRM
ncbi:MAG: aspartate/glutamate racemase family protein [Actinoallomurus sp.]